MKKALREMQTLRAGCSKAEPKKFAPPQTPFPGAQDGQNLISWRWSLPLPTDPVWWRSMHAILSYRGTRPPPHAHKYTHTHTNPQTGPITIYCAAKLNAQCNDSEAVPRHSVKSNFIRRPSYTPHCSTCCSLVAIARAVHTMFYVQCLR